MAHALPGIDDARLAARTTRLGKVMAVLVLMAACLAAAILIALAPAVASFACAVVAAGLWCRWLERHGITDEPDSQDFLRHSLAHLQGQSPTVIDEEIVR